MKKNSISAKLQSLQKGVGAQHTVKALKVKAEEPSFPVVLPGEKIHLFLSEPCILYSCSMLKLV